MLSHEQCEIARRYTKETSTDSLINKEFSELDEDQKILISNEAWGVYRQNGRLPMRDIKKLSAAYSLSLSTIYCIFKEKQNTEKALFNQHIGFPNNRFNGY